VARRWKEHPGSERGRKCNASPQACNQRLPFLSTSIHLTATVEDKPVRLSIEKGEFEKLVFKMDQLLQAITRTWPKLG
jgi:hypothetical protein